VTRRSNALLESNGTGWAVDVLIARTRQADRMLFE